MSKSMILFFWVCLAASILIVDFSAWAEAKTSIVAPKPRHYAGGRDEEELKVQESQNAPTLTVDRKMIEQKVLKNYFKKTGEDADSKPASQ